MAINILDLQPNVVSRDLGSRQILIYGSPKIGKTTFGANIPKSLLLAFEVGYQEIPGVVAQDVTSWSEMKLIARQLRKSEAREMYDTIVIDTASIAYDLCTKFVAAQNDVTDIGDIPYGKGWGLVQDEFFDTFKALSFLGYGIVFIAHEKVRVEKSESKGEYTVVSPDLSKRAYSVINKMVDIMAYITMEQNADGTYERVLYTREIPGRLSAGARNKYLAPKIPFSYEAVLDALDEAIDKLEAEGATVVDKKEAIIKKERSFEEVRAEAANLWATITENGQNEENAKRIMAIIYRYFKDNRRLSEIEEHQQEIFELIVEEMKSLL